MKKAFTMMELIFVLIIIGILAATILPEMGRNKLAQAAIQVVSHIRYTQHLAMIDDKFDVTDSNWFKKRWQIIFADSKTIRFPGITYSIFSDWKNTSSGNPDKEEIAKDPLNINKVLSGGHSNLKKFFDNYLNQKLNLKRTYGITKYSLGNGCSGARVAFDHFGRPFKGNMESTSSSYHKKRLIRENRCEITLTSSEGSIKIAIEPETGYTHILWNN